MCAPLRNDDRVLVFHCPHWRHRGWPVRNVARLLDDTSIQRHFRLYVYCYQRYQILQHNDWNRHLLRLGWHSDRLHHCSDEHPMRGGEGAWRSRCCLDPRVSSHDPVIGHCNSLLREHPMQRCKRHCGVLQRLALQRQRRLRHQRGCDRQRLRGCKLALRCKHRKR